MRDLRAGLVSVAAAASMLIASLAGGAAAATSKTLVIGDIQGLSGVAAQIGVWETQGAQVAINQFNSSGKLPGVKVVQKTEDSQWLANPAVQGYQQLTKLYHVQAVIAGGSAVMHALAPLATRDHVLLMNSGAQDPQLAGISPYMFNVLELSNNDATAMANYAYQDLHIRTVALMYVDNATGDIATYFANAFTKNGGKVVARQTFAQNATSFGTQLSAIAAANPQAVYIAGTPAEPPFIVKQIRQMGLKVTLLSYSAVETPQMLQIAGKAANGLYYTATYYDPNAKAASIRTFVDGYRRYYHQTPQSFYQALGYDSALVILDALVKDKGVYSGSALRKAIVAQHTFAGGTGTFSFNPNGTVVMPVLIKEIKNGAFVPVAKGKY